MNMRSYTCCKPLSSESKQISSLSTFFRMVSEESRLKLLCVFRRGSHCVCEMMEHLDLSQSLISHHLRDLKDAELVSSEKKGTRVYYSLTHKGRQLTDLIFKAPKLIGGDRK